MLVEFTIAPTPTQSHQFMICSVHFLREMTDRHTRTSQKITIPAVLASHTTAGAQVGILQVQEYRIIRVKFDSINSLLKRTSHCINKPENVPTANALQVSAVRRRSSRSRLFWPNIY